MDIILCNPPNAFQRAKRKRLIVKTVVALITVTAIGLVMYFN